ncbi:hypothetical protein KGQ20_02130 [Catenulispora sp. NF23]|uniref:Uncharacterized protein n=1 Tax=Catenulispora pinistramenti TaxID=2705254 RepID=A0ABS5KJA8_9ACTN|nr:DUF6283 family protein [Catenulispora pinistramenti]MBS2531563.1 hypothetical protein [Catenulispora pinistramenti]MBS2546187.1 hypothetical protein [Catenulispora pinistramenti]
MANDVRGPAPSPCTTCPYRRDVASGVWDEVEYEKLRGYDAPTWGQPQKVWICHSSATPTTEQRLCAGWCGCHDGEHLLALRVAAAHETLAPEVIEAAIEYVSPVPLFDSGNEAADHGMADFHWPGRAAIEATAKIRRLRERS